jgi:hypothetical protein
VVVRVEYVMLLLSGMKCVTLSAAAAQAAARAFSGPIWHLMVAD